MVDSVEVVPSVTDSTGTGSEGAAITLWGRCAIAPSPVAGSLVAGLENAWTTGSWAGVVSTGILWILVDSSLSDSAEDAPRGKSDCWARVLEQPRGFRVDKFSRTLGNWGSASVSEKA